MWSSRRCRVRLPAKPRETGYNVERIAGMWVQLMARLGYTRYAVHGSDWGSNVANRMALRDAAHVADCTWRGVRRRWRGPPEEARGAASGRGPAGTRSSTTRTTWGTRRFSRRNPQTLGHAQRFPGGPGVLIVEKWYGWADHDGDMRRSSRRISS